MKTSNATLAVAASVYKLFVGTVENVGPLRDAVFTVNTPVGIIAVRVFAVSKLDDDHRVRFQLVNSVLDRSSTFTLSHGPGLVQAFKDEVAYYEDAIRKHEARRVANAKIEAERNAIRDQVDEILRRHKALAKITVRVLDPRWVVLEGAGSSVTCPTAKAETMIIAMLA